MTKEELRKEVQMVSGEDPEKVKHVLDVCFDVLANALSEGIEVKLRGLGTFEQRRVKGRPSIHPITRKQITIAARRRIVFVPAQAVKEQLNK